MSTDQTITANQKCEMCQGDMVFDASQQVLICQKCGNSNFVTEQASDVEKSFHDLLINAPKWQKEASVFQCQHCGAKSVISKFDIVAACDYCGAENVNEIQEIPGVRPDTVVLFALSKEDAHAKAQTWLSKRFFVPNDFKQLAVSRTLHGVYFPAFNFDAQTSTRYHGVQVLTKTVSTVVNGETVTSSQDIRHPLRGFDKHIFDDLLVLANQAMTPKMLKSLQPFDTKKGKTFQQAYLSGFGVSQASTDPTQAWEDAKKQMEEVVRAKIIKQHSGVQIENLQLDMGITNVTYKYVLLPVYISHTEYKSAKYELCVNGQTGKVYCKTPKSRWKIFSFFATTFALCATGLGIVLAMCL